MSEIYHPYAITGVLPETLGFSEAFLEGRLGWDFDAANGGGRLPPPKILELVNQLRQATTSAAAIDERKKLLASLFSHHYDAARISFILQFFLPSVAKDRTSLNKGEAINILVTENVPFIPFEFLNLHLLNGLKKFKGKHSFPKLNLRDCYTNFLAGTPFAKNAKKVLSEAEKSEKLARAIAFWQDGVDSHNLAVPEKKMPHLSDEDIERLTPSSYSVSVKGTTNFIKPARTPEEESVRQRLLEAQKSKKRTDNLRAAEDLERRAKEFRDAVADDESVVSLKTAPRKKKRKDSDSEDDSDPKQGLHALAIFTAKVKRQVEEADYIEFASMSTSRLKQIKMLGITASTSSRLAVNLVLKHQLTEADITVLSEDFEEIRDGFFNHYITVVSESQLPNPMATVIDRIGWWKVLSNTFIDQPAAQVKFLRYFVLEHHATLFWAPLVKHESTMVAQCKEESRPLPRKPTSKDATPSGTSTPRPSKRSKLLQGKPPRYPPGSVVNPSQRVVYTATQAAKLIEWRKRFPGVCSSRLIKGHVCVKEQRNETCRFSHVCAWCKSATCMAACPQTENF